MRVLTDILAHKRQEVEARTVLVGTHFRRHSDPGVALQEFIAAAIQTYSE